MIKVKMQIIRKGTKYQGYRIAIPKPIIELYNLQNAEFELRIEKGKIILIPKKK